MRICVICPYDLAEEGGVKRHCVHLASALRRLGDEVDILGPCRDDRTLGDDVHGFRGVINIPNNGSDNHIGIFACPYKVRRFVRARRHDIIHVHEPLIPSLSYWAMWSAGPAARVATFHAFSEHEGALSRWARRIFSTIALRSYDRGIAVSPAAARFAQLTFRKPLAIIPNGIRADLYAGRPPAPPGDALRLLFVGHWRDPRKGLPHLLDACAKLTMPWTLDVVGDGGGLPRSTLPGVRYHGPISSETAIAALYASCDVFVAPSTGMESFGIVLLEAMAAGRAIVCSDIEGYRHAVGTGPGALRVAPGDVDGLAARIAELATDPDKRARLGAINRERVRAFEWDQLAVRVRSEYAAALDARHGTRVAAACTPVAPSRGASEVEVKDATASRSIP